MKDASVRGRTGPAWKARLWRAVRLLLLIYLGVCLVISLMQDWFIFPGQATQGQRQAIIAPSRDSEVVPLTSSTGDKIVVLFGKALDADGGVRTDSAKRPTIIFFYGNGMCLADAIGLCRGWRKLGANALGVEYPGYGMSGGKPGEKPFYAAADAAYDYLLSRDDIDKKKIMAAGLSLGTGVAVDLAAQRRIAGLALFSPYTSLDDLARAAVPWLPMATLLNHHFDSHRKISSIHVPILMAHGTYDSIIPHEMSKRLAKAANGNATLVLVETDHNDLFDRAGPKLAEAMSRLVEQVNGTP